MMLDRKIFMNNVSNKKLIFEAELPSDVFRIEPRKGELEPQSRQILTLSITCPESPTIMQVTIPIIFREPIGATAKARVTVIEADQEEILAIDPAIDYRLQNKSARQRLKERDENWKSVGERTLEASVKTKPTTNDNLFSTHIGQRGTPSRGGPQPPTYRQILDVVFNVVSKEEYRDKYHSINTFCFEVENPEKTEFSLQQKEDIADILGSVVDQVIADEQEKRSAMSDAQLRRQHVPLFSQLYKAKPVVELERQEVPDGKHIDNMASLLHDVIDETIVEAADGKFNLTKEIIHVSGFRSLQ
jgi:hypothetical protein